MERTDILLNYINDFIFYKNKVYKNLGYIISIYNNYIYISYYHGKEYKLSVVEENNDLFFLLVPFKNSYYTTIIIDPVNAFDRILAAIRQNEL